jgi:cysteine-rich repeat protein
VAFCVKEIGETVGYCKVWDKYCEDSTLCTEDSCNPTTGHCEYSIVNCDDGSPCTSDYCLPGKGCLHDLLVPCCPNGLVEAGEDCDDFNLLAGDGCSPTCIEE